MNHILYINSLTLEFFLTGLHIKEGCNRHDRVKWLYKKSMKFIKYISLEQNYTYLYCSYVYKQLPHSEHLQSEVIKNRKSRP
jgi:hypothetical protein